MEEAKSLLTDGEPLVEVYPEEYAKFLCKKAKILQMIDESDEAQKALEQAESIAKKVNQSDDSELIRAIQEAREFISRSVSIDKYSMDCCYPMLYTLCTIIACISVDTFDFVNESILFFLRTGFSNVQHH